MNQHSAACHRIPGLSILVDGFKFAGPHVSAYFLTHAHADHWAGLDKAAVTCPVYMTNTTHALVAQRMQHVDKSLVNHLQLEEEVLVDVPEARLRVTPVNANHCLGAVILVFEVWHVAEGSCRDSAMTAGKPHIFIHTGDMRFSESVHCTSRTLQRIRAAGVDTVWLDTTYANVPRFPTRPDAIQEVIQLCKQHETNLGARVLYVVCTYLIGKEQVLLALARAMGMKIFLDPRKNALLSAMGLSSEQQALFTDDPYATRLHVQRMGWCGDVWPFFQPRYGRMTSHVARYAQGTLAPGAGGADADSDDDQGTDVEYAPSAAAQAVGSASPVSSSATAPPPAAAASSAQAAATPAPQASLPEIKRIVSIVPTGWAIKTKPPRRTMRWTGPLLPDQSEHGGCELEHVIHLVPYSEHSCGDELHSFVSWLRPACVEPIVFSDAAHRRRIQHAFRGDVSRTAAKAKFIKGLFGTATAGHAAAVTPPAPPSRKAGGVEGGRLLSLDARSGAGGGASSTPPASDAPYRVHAQAPSAADEVIVLSDSDSDSDSGGGGGSHNRQGEAVHLSAAGSGASVLARRGDKRAPQGGHATPPSPAKQQRKLTALFRRS